VPAVCAADRTLLQRRVCAALCSAGHILLQAAGPYARACICSSSSVHHKQQSMLTSALKLNLAPSSVPLMCDRGM
jgi:hypothetical protein